MECAHRWSTRVGNRTVFLNPVEAQPWLGFFVSLALRARLYRSAPTSSWQRDHRSNRYTPPTHRRCLWQSVSLTLGPNCVLIQTLSPNPRFGSSGWIRTNDLVVNSHPLYR